MIPFDILKQFGNKVILVTGGTGMIGRQIVRILCEAGAQVRSVSLDQLNLYPTVDHIYGDLNDFIFCKKITCDVDYVFHVAGIKGSIEVTKSKPASFFVPLLMMNTNILEACRVNNVKKIIFTSSIGAYSSSEIFREAEELETEPPMDMFPGWAKRMAEMQIQTYRIQYGLENFAVVRLGNVYGPGDNYDPSNAMVIPSLMHRIYHGEDPLVVWGDGKAIRDFAYCEDIAYGIILALYYGTNGRYINLGSGRGYTIRYLIETLNSFIDFNYYFDDSKPTGFPKRVMDITLARNILGFNPTTSLLDGLKKTWEWFISNSNEHLKRKNYFIDNA